MRTRALPRKLPWQLPAEPPPRNAAPPLVAPCVHSRGGLELGRDIGGENGRHRSAHIQFARCPLSRDRATLPESAVTDGALCAKSRSIERAPAPLTRTANPTAIASR